jgi:predicted nucleic acid-binding protein
MNIEEALQGVNRLFLDTAPVIYGVERNPQYLGIVREIFHRIRDGTLIAVTSPITLAECLVNPYRLGQIQLQQDFIDVLVNGNNVRFVSISTPTIALQAAQIRARYNLHLLDAFQLATALIAGCEAFLTNDIILRRVTELSVLVLDDLETSE